MAVTCENRKLLILQSMDPGLSSKDMEWILILKSSMILTKNGKDMMLSWKKESNTFWTNWKKWVRKVCRIFLRSRTSQRKINIFVNGSLKRRAVNTFTHNFHTHLPSRSQQHTP